MSTTYQRPRGAPGGGVLKLPRATSVGIAVSSLNDGFTLLELADARNAKRGQETQFPSILLTAQDGSTWRVNALAKGSGSGTLQLAVVPGGTPIELMAAKGVTDGSNAAPGQIGEYRSASVIALIAIGAGVNVALTSISLSAGDWDMEGSAYFQASNSGGTDDLRAGFNTVSAVLPDGTSGGLAILSTSSGGLINSMAIPPMRFNLTASTTVYLNCYADFGIGTMQARGFMAARRVR